MRGSELSTRFGGGAAVEGLYFGENKSIETKEVLQSCPEDVGLGEKCRELLANDETGKDEVMREKQEYGRTFQRTGVPLISKYIREQSTVSLQKKN